MTAAGDGGSVKLARVKPTDETTTSRTSRRERTMRTGFVERYGKLAELDRSFDLKFWQAQPAQARFDATWELIVHASRVKGGDVRQLRLQRAIEAFQRQPG